MWTDFVFVALIFGILADFGPAPLTDLGAPLIGLGWQERSRGSRSKRPEYYGSTALTRRG